MKSEAETHADETRLRHQRDTAIVCAVLSATLALAMLLNNFGKDVPGLAVTREAVLQHRKILAEHQIMVESVTSSLGAHEKEWARLRAARPDLR